MNHQTAATRLCNVKNQWKSHFYSVFLKLFSNMHIIYAHRSLINNKESNIRKPIAMLNIHDITNTSSKSFIY